MRLTKNSLVKPFFALIACSKNCENWVDSIASQQYTGFRL